MKKNLTAVVLLALLTGCAVPGIGEKQADTPPRIVIKGEHKTWDNPGAFGPVPESLLVVGARVCASLNTDQTKYIALGYHANALDLEGNRFPTGGYYCVPDNRSKP